jgi:prolipoprotein diacylglyceryltransferase
MAGILVAAWLSARRWTSWDGGPGIWGAIALGVLGAWISCRRAGVSLVAFLDTAAPGVVFAQSLGRRFSLGAGSVFALYVAGYTAGRFTLELMRSDFANLILGLRVNIWAAALIFLAGTIAFVLLFRRRRSTAIGRSSAHAHLLQKYEVPLEKI